MEDGVWQATRRIGHEDAKDSNSCRWTATRYTIFFIRWTQKRSVWHFFVTFFSCPTTLPFEDKMPYTRESLVADWASIGSSYPLSHEVENVFLAFFNKQINEMDVQSHERVVPFPLQRSAQPPTRYQRNKNETRGYQDFPPSGPAHA